MRPRIIELQRQAGQVPGLKPEIKITFGEHLNWWLDHHAPQRCTPKTLERYRQLADYVLKDTTGSDSALSVTLLKDVTAGQLESVLYDLLKAPAKRRKHLSAKTICHVAGVINVSLNKAFKMDRIPVNPMPKVEQPKVEKRDARSLTPQEIEALLNMCLNDWTHPFVQVDVATACRRGELCAIEKVDIDFSNFTLKVSKSLEQTKQGLRVKKPKNGKTRTFVLPQSAITALRFQLERQEEFKRLFGPDYIDRNLVFSQPNGDYLNPALVSQTIARRMRKAGIKDASLHTLRHTHASGLLSARIPLPVVSKRLGHANTNITASVYAHALPADDQKAADKWDEIIAPKVQ
jgi:integrase